MNIKLLHLFWNNIGEEELVKHFGDGTDKFIGPNTFIREGVFEIENEDFEGLEYKATITLGRLVPKKAQPALVQSTKGKKAAAQAETRKSSGSRRGAAPDDGQGDFNASCTHR